MTETTAVIELKKSYGTGGGGGAGELHQQQPIVNLMMPMAGNVYCVHEKLASTCCDKRPSERLHCHKKVGHGHGDSKARRKLIVACILCICFIVVEIVGGILSNSLAIATDAAHLLTDLTSFLISLFALWIARRPSTKK